MAKAPALGMFQRDSLVDFDRGSRNRGSSHGLVNWLHGLYLAVAGLLLAPICSAESDVPMGLKSVGDPVVIRQHTETVHAIALTPDGTGVISGGLDSQINAFLLKNGSPEFMGGQTHWDGIHDLELLPSPQGLFIVSCSRTRWPNTSGTLRLATSNGNWQRSTGGAVGSNFNAVALSGTGLIAVGGNDRNFGNLRVFDLTRLDMNAKAAEGSLDPCEIKPTAGAFPSYVASLTFAPPPKGKANSMLLGVGCATGIIKVVSVSKSGIVESPTTFQGHGIDAVIFGLAFSSDGQVLISAASDSTIRFWIPQNGTEITQRRITTSALTSFNFEPQSGLLVSGHSDGTVRIFDTQGGPTPVLEVKTNRPFPIRGVVIVSLPSTSGKKTSKKPIQRPRIWRIAAGDEDKAATIWTIESVVAK